VALSCQKFSNVVQTIRLLVQPSSSSSTSTTTTTTTAAAASVASSNHNNGGDGSLSSLLLNLTRLSWKSFKSDWLNAESQYVATKNSLGYFNKGKFSRAIKDLTKLGVVDGSAKSVATFLHEEQKLKRLTRKALGKFMLSG
jgi:subtilase family serine protease